MHAETIRHISFKLTLNYEDFLNLIKGGFVFTDVNIPNDDDVFCDNKYQISINADKRTLDNLSFIFTYLKNKELHENK